MFLKLTRLLLLLCLTNIVTLSAYAQTTRYITDDLQVTLRSGKGTQFKVVRSLDSGTKVELLETDSDSGYSRVRTEGGQEGWMLTRFLVDVPSAREQLADAKQKLVNLGIETNRLNDQVSKLKVDNTQLEKKTQTLTDTNHRLDQQLTSIRQTASNALALDSENKTLKGKVVDLERRVQSLDQENSVLKDRRNRDWFITGALVLGGGIILGLIIPKLRLRRKSNWDSL